MWGMRPMTPNPCVSASEAPTRDVILDRVCDRIDAEEVTYASIYRYYRTVRAKMYERLARREHWRFSLKAGCSSPRPPGLGSRPRWTPGATSASRSADH